jgi:predicted NAD/FAD-dependent oxidoreductase
VSLKELQIPLHSPIINSIVLSNTAADYAPKDQQLIATTTLIDINRAELHKELDSLWQRPTEKWELVTRTVVENALALHRPSQVLVQPSTIEKGIYLAGDWRAIPAQQGALLSGRLAAMAVISDLQAR